MAQGLDFDIRVETAATGAIAVSGDVT